MKPSSLKELWNQYYELVMRPNGISQETTQYREMKRSFYAGSHGILMQQLCVLSEVESEEESINYLKGWNREARDFAKEIAEGRA